jgi:YspA, cpYpsA-related SLOG family
MTDNTTPRRVLVCGGRDYTEWDVVRDTLESLRIRALCHGAAKGADTLAAAYGKQCEGFFETFAYPADWTKDGRAAGPIRNQRMLDEFQPDLVVAFPGGRGTADMVKRARRANIEVLEAQR